MAFPSGQYTSPLLHPCNSLFDQDGYQDSSTNLSIVQILLPLTFGYSLCSEAKVIDTLTQEDIHGAFQKMLEWYKYIAAGGDYVEEN